MQFTTLKIFIFYINLNLSNAIYFKNTDIHGNYVFGDVWFGNLNGFYIHYNGLHI